MQGEKGTGDPKGSKLESAAKEHKRVKKERDAGVKAEKGGVAHASAGQWDSSGLFGDEKSQKQKARLMSESAQADEAMAKELLREGKIHAPIKPLEVHGRAMRSDTVLRRMSSAQLECRFVQACAAFTFAGADVLCRRNGSSFPRF